MKQIYIGNVLEAYYRSYQRLNRKDKEYWMEYDKLDNNRSLLYGGDNKAIITPTPIQPAHLEFTCDLSGWKNVINLFPQQSTESICSDLINDAKINGQVLKLIEDNPGIEIIPYRHTEEFYKFIDYLNERKLRFKLPETLPGEFRFVESYFHSKRGFRHLWEMIKDDSLDIGIPEGFITADREEAIQAAKYFKANQKDFVFKYNRGVQGVGVLLNNIADLPDDSAEFEKSLYKMLEDDIWLEGCIVVEQKIDVDVTVLGGSPNVEMKILENGDVTESYACEQVLDKDRKTFMGVGINKEVHKNTYMKTAFKAAKRYGQKLSDMGYRGVFDMDLVISKDRKLYAVEANLRRTGGTHIHEFCETLLGSDYMFNYCVKSYETKTGQNGSVLYEEIKERLVDLMVTKERNQGLIFANPDFLKMGHLVLMLISDSRAGLADLEKRITERVNV